MLGVSRMTEQVENLNIQEDVLSLRIENKALREVIVDLEAQIEKMKNCKNCANYMISGKCPCFFRTGWCKNWEMAKGVSND